MEILIFSAKVISPEDVEFSCPKPTNCCVDLAYFSAASTALVIYTPAQHEFSRHNYGDMKLETVQTQGKNQHLLSQLCSLNRQNTEKLKAQKGEKPHPR